MLAYDWLSFGWESNQSAPRILERGYHHGSLSRQTWWCSCVSLFLILREKRLRKRELSSDLFLHRHAHRFETLATPHSKQHVFDLDVISPQFGHILCPDPATAGFSLHIQWSSRSTNSTIRRAEEILITLINALLFVDCRIVGIAPESACL